MVNIFHLFLLYEKHRKFTTENYHFFCRDWINFEDSEMETPHFTTQINELNVFCENIS